MALVVVGAVCVCLYQEFFPAIRQAIQALPEEGAVRDGELILSPETSAVLAEGRYLSFVVDLDGRSGVNATGDFVVKFRRNSFRICSLFGCWAFRYPANAPFNRPDLQPWWDAWEPNFYWMIGGVVMVSLLGSWFVLAAFYAPAAVLLAYFNDRELTWIGAWKLASAALMLGALLLSAGVAGYGWDAVNLIRLALLWPLHLVVGWVYLAWAVSHLSKVQDGNVVSVNPFADRAAGSSIGQPDPAPPPEPGTASNETNGH